MPESKFTNAWGIGEEASTREGDQLGNRCGVAAFTQSATHCSRSQLEFRLEGVEQARLANTRFSSYHADPPGYTLTYGVQSETSAVGDVEHWVADTLIRAEELHGLILTHEIDLGHNDECLQSAMLTDDQVAIEHTWTKGWCSTCERDQDLVDICHQDIFFVGSTGTSAPAHQLGTPWDDRLNRPRGAIN